MKQYTLLAISVALSFGICACESDNSGGDNSKTGYELACTQSGGAFADGVCSCGESACGAGIVCVDGACAETSLTDAEIFVAHAASAAVMLTMASASATTPPVPAAFCAMQRLKNVPISLNARVRSPNVSIRMASGKSDPALAVHGRNLPSARAGPYALTKPNA